MDSLAAPKGLLPSNIPLTIVFGPPCAGKSTYVNKHSKASDIVIDLDDIVEKMTGERWPTNTKHLPKAIAKRNKIIRSLSSKTDGRAWLILTGPSVRERSWWKRKLGAESVVIDPGVEVCLDRCEDRGTPWLVHPILLWYRGRDWKPPRETIKDYEGR